jgi:succinyl-CoA synthetase beta subunit
MSIEEDAHKDPSKIFKYHVNTFEGLDVDKLLEAADNLGIKE